MTQEVRWRQPPTLEFFQNERAVALRATTTNSARCATDMLCRRPCFHACSMSHCERSPVQNRLPPSQLRCAGASHKYRGSARRSATPCRQRSSANGSISPTTCSATSNPSKRSNEGKSTWCGKSPKDSGKALSYEIRFHG